jgi:hypothetical protein
MALAGVGRGTAVLDEKRKKVRGQRGHAAGHTCRGNDSEGYGPTASSRVGANTSTMGPSPGSSR